LSTAVDKPLSWLVYLWSLFSRCKLDSFLDQGTLKSFYVQDELKELCERFLSILADVFVADDVDWDLSFQPEFVKVAPNSYFLFYEFVPSFEKLFKVIIVDRQVMAA
jgi:hypothetical protein